MADVGMDHSAHTMTEFRSGADKLVAFSGFI